MVYKTPSDESDWNNYPFLNKRLNPFIKFLAMGDTMKGTRPILLPTEHD